MTLSRHSNIFWGVHVSFSHISTIYRFFETAFLLAFSGSEQIIWDHVPLSWGQPYPHFSLFLSLSHFLFWSFLTHQRFVLSNLSHKIKSPLHIRSMSHICSSAFIMSSIVLACGLSHCLISVRPAIHIEFKAPITSLLAQSSFWHTIILSIYVFWLLLVYYFIYLLCNNNKRNHKS